MLWACLSHGRYRSLASCTHLARAGRSIRAEHLRLQRMSGRILTKSRIKASNLDTSDSKSPILLVPDTTALKLAQMTWVPNQQRLKIASQLARRNMLFCSGVSFLVGYASFAQSLFLCYPVQTRQSPLGHEALQCRTPQASQT